MSDVKDLKDTLRQMSTTMPDVKYVETVFGGNFYRGKRKINVAVAVHKAHDDKYLKDGSMKIRRMGNEFGISLHPGDTRDYMRIKNLVNKGLGGKG